MICIDLGVIALLVALPVAVRLALAEGGANNSSTEKHGSCAICAAGMTRKGGCGWRVDVDRQWAVGRGGMRCERIIRVAKVSVNELCRIS